MYHILIAPNAFKNSITATEAAEAIRKGLYESRLNCTCECFPIGDGGDGTGDLLMNKLNGLGFTTKVHDPLERIISASYGLLKNGSLGMIEMASASGLRLMTKNELDPLRASSYGTGELIRAVLDKGISEIIIGMGGSATVDGGVGILQALGVRFLGPDNKQLDGSPESIINLVDIDISCLDTRVLDCDLTILCDVDNQLLGENGSAHIFGPQKGALPDAVIKLEASLKRLSEVTLHQTGKNISNIKYGGTAGGAAAGLYAFLNAKLVNGIDYYLQLTDFDKALEQADLVITGEGSIDKQTLQGKGPFGVAYKAKSKSIPVIVLAGKVPLVKDVALQEYFDVLMPIGDCSFDMETALASTSTNLTRTSREIGNILSLVKS
jgi:glycerate kinase